MFYRTMLIAMKVVTFGFKVSKSTPWLFMEDLAYVYGQNLSHFWVHSWIFFSADTKTSLVVLSGADERVHGFDESS